MPTITVNNVQLYYELHGDGDQVVAEPPIQGLLGQGAGFHGVEVDMGDPLGVGRHLLAVQRGGETEAAAGHQQNRQYG